MQKINRFFKWWNKTFRKQGVVGKTILVCSSLIIILCSCSTSIAIFSPNTQATLTADLAVTPPVIQIENATVTSPPTNGNEPSPTLSFSPSSAFAITETFSPSIVPSLTATGYSTSPQAAQNPIRVHFIDVGQGDATLIQTPHGQTVLIDGGDTDTGIVHYLQSIGIQRIDLMIATHVHSDHIGGLVQVLQAFPVTKVVTNGEPYTTSVYEHFLDAITAAKADYLEIKRGDVLSLDGIDFHCLSPVTPTNPDPNENSIVLKFAYGKTTFLMMGDAGAATEADLLASNLLSKVDILKVGHHGSKTGTIPAFLNVVRPGVAIYFAGVNNIYGLPDQQTISALKAAGAIVYGTDINGTILITADLNGYTINNAKSVGAGTPTPAIVLTQSPTISFTGGLDILSVTSPVDKGSLATLTAKTSPNASCTITVSYKSGPSHASELGPKSADARGTVSWTWRVGAGTTSGTWSINVTCNGVTKSTTFTVR
jgi:beta-lactamase superfamily II metal-dependent hydrolase